MSYDLTQGLAGCSNTIAPRGYNPPSVKERIEEQIATSQKRLSDLQQLRDLLDKNPDFETMMSLLGKGLL
jgi:hypothetical protein